MLLDLPQAPLRPLTLPWLETAKNEAAILRLDLIDPLISGNKWFKLRHHLQHATASNAPGLISLGGHAQDTPTVRDLQALGMELHWLGYGGYRARNEAGFWAPWQARYPGWHCIPEGGGGLAGAQGCALLMQQARGQIAALGWSGYDAWWLAAGTGTTLAGLVMAEAGAHVVHGALAVPRDHGVAEAVATLAGAHGYQLHDACRGGFGKFDDELLAFIADCERHTGVPLEALYTGKALLALREQVGAGLFAPGTRLIVVHTGGLQGRRGYL